MKHIEIKIGEGLGDINFGISKDELEKVIGAPNEKEIFSSNEDDDTEIWHYDTLEVSFSFNKENNWLLSTIASSSELTTFEGEKIIDLDVDSFTNLLKAKGYEDIINEDLSTEEEPNNHLVFLEEESINFWFEEGELSEIQWGIIEE